MNTVNKDDAGKHSAQAPVVPKTSVQNLGQNFGFFFLICAVIFSATLIWFDSRSRYELIDLTLRDGLGPKLPEISATSPTGYEGGMRRLILPAVGADGYQWLMHTQKMVQDGGWRIRETDTDNAPQGREIHWSHSFIWWLILTGKVHSLLTGYPLPASIEAVTPYANTLFLIPILLILPWIVFRGLGWAAGVVIALGFSSIYLFYELFLVGYADHHGLAALGAMCASLFLVIGGGGWFRTSTPTPPELVFGNRKSAARWFVASGLLAAFGLWISAATLAPVLAGIGLGALLGGWAYCRKTTQDFQYDPSLWRLWGLAGACGSMAFYLLEYFPNHMGMRLEVNHPLYAIAFYCGGDIIARLLSSRLPKNNIFYRPLNLLPLCISLVGVSLLPLLIKFAPDRFFQVSDPFLWALHKDYIHEFKTILGRLKDMDMQGALVILSALPLVMIAMARLFFLKAFPAPWRSLLVVALGPALVLFTLGLIQVRWLGISNGLWLVALATTVGGISAACKYHRFRIWEKIALGVFLAAVFLPHPWLVTTVLVEARGKKPNIGPGSAFVVLVRDAAQTLRRMNGDKPMRVLSGPTTSTWLSFYGGMQSVGTLYWENIEGLKAAADMYSSKTENEALELLVKRGITHIVIFSIDEFSAPYIRLARGLPEGSEPKDAFADAVLFGRSFPRWVTPIHYAMHEQFKNEWVAILEVKPDQTEAEARLGIGRFLASRGDIRGARQEFLEAIKLDPNLADAHLELAGFLYLAGDILPARIHLGEGLKGKSNEQIAESCFTIASYCQDAGRQAYSVELLRRALQAAPDAASIRNLLAWILATSSDDSVRKPEEALNLAITNFGFIGQSAYVNTLAAAQAANGQFDNAVISIDAALVVAREAGEPERTIKIYETRRALYKAQNPYRE